MKFEPLIADSAVIYNGEIYGAVWVSGRNATATIAFVAPHPTCSASVVVQVLGPLGVKLSSQPYPKAPCKAKSIGQIQAAKESI